MKGFLGAFLRGRDNGLNTPGQASNCPHGAREPSDSVSTEHALSAQEAGLPATGHEDKNSADTELSAERKVGCRNGVAGQLTWDETRAAALVAEVDRIIATEIASGTAANTEARRRVLKNDGSIVRRLQQSRDRLLWQWPEATYRLLARWAGWDRGRTD